METEGYSGECRVINEVERRFSDIEKRIIEQPENGRQEFILEVYGNLIANYDKRLRREFTRLYEVGVKGEKFTKEGSEFMLNRFLPETIVMQKIIDAHNPNGSVDTRGDISERIVDAEIYVINYENKQQIEENSRRKMLIKKAINGTEEVKGRRGKKKQHPINGIPKKFM